MCLAAVSGGFLVAMGQRTDISPSNRAWFPSRTFLTASTPSNNSPGLGLADRPCGRGNQLPTGPISAAQWEFYHQGCLAYHSAATIERRRRSPCNLASTHGLAYTGCCYTEWFGTGRTRRRSHRVLDGPSRVDIGRFRNRRHCGRKLRGYYPPGSGSRG